MRGFEEVESTNTEATAWAREGADEGSVVVTEFQTKGRGRHGRTWAADKGTNLMFSTVLRPPLPPDRLGLVTLAAGLAVAESIDDFVSPHRAAIKWPNDVLLEGRKTCGMLLEGSFSGPRASAESPEFVVLGVGLNVNQTEFPAALADSATSLRLTAGRSIPRAPLLAQILKHLEVRYETLCADGADGIRTAFRDRMDRLGERVTLRFTGSDRSVSGRIQGIAPDGGLRLRTDNGEAVMHAGEVTTDGG